MKSSTSAFSTTPKNKLRLALVVPHLFIHRDILPRVIFSPGELAVRLAEGLQEQGIDVTLYAPGPVDTTVPTVTADLSYFEDELSVRGDSYLDLLKKHPATFVGLARQVQSEVLAKAFAAANNNQHDIVHVYTNEEDLALPFSRLCSKPVVFTHHDPFNFLVKYKNNFPKYTDLNWISLSYAQRRSMPDGTNWVGNIYHGLPIKAFTPIDNPSDDYVAFLGRIVQPKGLHLAIAALKEYNLTAKKPLKLKIAGKHYADTSSDDYWQTTIEPEIGGLIEYVGFIKGDTARNKFLGNARALIIPSLFDEPFGMVMIESLASGTPIIGLNSGAIPEIITVKNGILVGKRDNSSETIKQLSTAIESIGSIDRVDCRTDFETRFSAERMCKEHADVYKKLVAK
ncbi:MAG: glycosyltransferase [Candidatus Microsaccharimonas sp.]